MSNIELKETITKAKRQYAQIERVYRNGKNIDKGSESLNKTMETIRRNDLHAYYRLTDCMMVCVRYALYSGKLNYIGTV